MKALIALVGFAVLAGCKSDQCSQSAAYAAIQEEITPRLVSPGSAIFERASSALTQSGDECRFRYRGWVDSQNRAGGLLRTEWMGNVELTNNGSYRATVIQASGFRFSD
jgi:hypothetical protein